MTWYTDDPRYTIGKRAIIIIYSASSHKVWCADVETKHGFYIHGYKDDLHADDNWPEHLMWCYAPKDK